MYNHTKSRVSGFSRNRGFSRARRSPSVKGYIHPSRFVNRAVALSEQQAEPIAHRFDEFSLDGRLIEQILARGYSIPTPIQDKAIPLAMAGRDVVGIADTGTGKTAAFLLPLLHKLLQDRSQKTLVIVPTHELAVQIEQELKQFSRGLGVDSALCIGGTGLGGQIQSLRREPHFIIGTPGRLKDHLRRKTLRLYNITNLVLDEADRMVEMGFIADVRDLISQMPKKRQSLFFSATITPEVQTLFGNFSDNPVSVSVKSRETCQNVEQDIVRFNDQFHKMSLLHDLLIKDDFKKVLIFGRTKHGVERLSNDLVERGFKAISIHGNKRQSQRKRCLDEFKSNQTQILVATDVAARGLDIPDVTHVINFDAPEAYADYVHRIGRTGRANKRGVALTFIGARV